MRDAGFLDQLGHFLLATVTTQRVGVAAILLLGAFAFVTRRQKSRWPTQAEVIKCALEMLGFPTATQIFAALVLLPPQLPGVSEDSFIAAGLIGTIVVFTASCSALSELLRK